MIDMGIIQGSKEQAVPLIIGKDTVYEHAEIEQVFEDQDGNSVDDLFKYREIQYDKDEYIGLIGEKNQELEKALLEITTNQAMKDMETDNAILELTMMLGGV